ncbi:DoxX family protein [Nonomuraea sp. NPDC049784]|uniref:DoxX family protein n=1 Tax=Nonomuraea sp. NPDC049784 TaxID=3154361 RepID=UPI0033EEF873
MTATSTTVTRVWPRRLLTLLYWFLAVEFVIGAVTKYWPGPTFFGPAYSVKFADWGYPPYARFAVGAIELICAILLVLPDRRYKFLGASTLVLVLTGAVTTHIVNHDPIYESVSAPIHLMIMAIIALATWPAHWLDLFRSHAAFTARRSYR